MFITAAVGCVKYWPRIASLPDDRLAKRKPCKMLHYLQDLGNKTCAYQLRILLFENGFGDVWLQQGVGHVSRFVSVFRHRLIDQSRQNWNASVREKERFDFRSLFKQNIQPEK